jgi:hypothetical protein
MRYTLGRLEGQQSGMPLLSILTKTRNKDHARITSSEQFSRYVLLQCYESLDAIVLWYSDGRRFFVLSKVFS